MTTASVHISSLLLEGVSIVVDRQSTLSHQLGEVGLGLVHLFKAVLRNLVQLIFGLVAVGVKELHASLCAEHTTPMPRVLVFGEKENDTPPF